MTSGEDGALTADGHYMLFAGRRWRASSSSPTQTSSPVRFCPPRPPGDESWFDWAQRFWPSLAQGLNGRLTER